LAHQQLFNPTVVQIEQFCKLIHSDISKQLVENDGPIRKGDTIHRAVLIAWDGKRKYNSSIKKATGNYSWLVQSIFHFILKAEGQAWKNQTQQKQQPQKKKMFPIKV
tara:strand:- start:122 stop:442 length:321 start_codon:yes stop_codon:yes gene_type:complete